MELFKYAVQSWYLEYIDDRGFFMRKFATEFLFLINKSLYFNFVIIWPNEKAFNIGK